MKSKWKSAAVVLMLALSLLVSACSAKPAQPTAQPTPQSAADAKPKEFVKLKMFYICGDNCPQKDQPLVQEAVNKITREKINAEVELNPIDWSKLDNIKLILQTGEQVDIVWTASWLGYFNNAVKKAFYPMNDPQNNLLDKYGQGIKAALPPAALEATKVKGIMYGVPVNKDLATGYAMFYRKDFLDKYNIDPKTLKYAEDLEPIFKLIKDKEPGMYPIWMGDNDYFPRDQLPAKGRVDWKGFESVPGAPDGIFFETATGKVSFMPDNPGNMADFKLIRKFYEAGYINKDAATSKTKPKEQFKAGKLWYMFGSNKPGAAKEAEADVKVPLVQADSITPAWVDTGSLTSSMHAIGRTSKDPARAMMFLNLLYTDKELVNLLVWGIEGKHYVKVSDKVIKLPDGVKNRTEAGYNPGISWQLGNQFLNYLWDNEDPDKWVQYKKYNEEAKPTKQNGFNFDPEKVKSEVSACSNVWTEYRPLLETGTLDPEETMKKYKDKALANGMDKIVAEVQSQLDEWRKSK